jgi:hypothetical protein
MSTPLEVKGKCLVAYAVGGEREMFGVVGYNSPDCPVSQRLPAQRSAAVGYHN